MDKTTEEWFDIKTVKLIKHIDLEGFLSDEDLIRLSGAPKGSTVRVQQASYKGNEVIEIRASNPGLLKEDMVRLIVQTEEDGQYAFVIVNSIFVLEGRTGLLEEMRKYALGGIPSAAASLLGPIAALYNRATNRGDPMNAADILRRFTTPMTNAEVKDLVRDRYGGFRENASIDTAGTPDQAHDKIKILKPIQAAEKTVAKKQA